MKALEQLPVSASGGRLAAATALIVALFCSNDNVVFAASAKVGAIVSFEGACERVDFDDDNKSTCDGMVANLRFVDGYDSIQFNSGNATFSFVGSVWKDNSGPNSMLPDNVLFMPLKQVIFGDKKTGKINIENRKGQCVMTFAQPDQHDVSSVTEVRCEYDGKTPREGGHVMTVLKISKFNVMLTGGQSDAAARGYSYYR